MLVDGRCVLDNMSVQAGGEGYALLSGHLLMLSAPTTAAQAHFISDCSFTAPRRKLGVPLLSLGPETKLRFVVILDGCTVDGSASGGVACTHSTLLSMCDCVIANNGTAGVEVREGGVLKMQHCFVRKNKQGTCGSLLLILLLLLHADHSSAALLGRRRHG